MEPVIDMKQLHKRFQQYQNSPEYQKACLHFQSECSRLTVAAKQLLEHLPQIQEDCMKQAIRREFASGSTLHRGFYCPSPVYELIVGNTKRGKILKRITSRSNPSHEYGFNADGRLLWCKVLHDRAAVFTEYLVYREHSVLGITVDCCGQPVTITEEVYENERIVRYLNGLCLDFSDSLQCPELNCEYYSYDQDGLYSCEIHSYMQARETPPDFLHASFAGMSFYPIYRSNCLVFERKEGYLVSYTDKSGYTYRPGIQRKA